jgi:hypothetical protein
MDSAQSNLWQSLHPEHALVLQDTSAICSILPASWRSCTPVQGHSPWIDICGYAKELIETERVNAD